MSSHPANNQDDNWIALRQVQQLFVLEIQV